jgi:formylmethanofuran:tetrahydromethanopterin formyltransferase
MSSPFAGFLVHASDSRVLIVVSSPATLRRMVGSDVVTEASAHLLCRRHGVAAFLRCSVTPGGRLAVVILAQIIHEAELR